MKHEAERDNIQNDTAQKVNGLINEFDNEKELKVASKVYDEELENI